MIQGRRRYFWEAAKFLMGVVLGVALIIPISFLLPVRPQAQPVRLIENTYVPFSGCPGDLADPYVLTWEIRRPVINMINISHLRSPDGDTVIPARNRNTFITGFPSERIVTDADSSFALPDLPPGDYDRIIMIATRSGSKPVFVEMPYTIRDDCP